MTHFEECVADLTMPKGWVDESYGNDVCPSWSYKGFQVMIHHADTKREESFRDALRFYIFKRDEYGDSLTWSAEANTFNEVTKIINKKHCKFLEEQG